MKYFQIVVLLFVYVHVAGQTETDQLIESLKLKKSGLEESSAYTKFCPTCSVNQAESWSKSRTVLQSNHSVEKRSTYYFNYDSDNNLESVVISGFAGLIDNHYRYLIQYGLKNSLVTKKQAENPGRTSFQVTVRRNTFNCLLIKRVTSKGVYYFIKFTYIAVPDF